MPRLAPEDSFFIELGDIPTQILQQASPFDGDPKGLAGPRVGGLSGPTEPTFRFHAGKRGIERSRAQSVAMLGELLDQPRAPDVARLGVMEDVDPPDSKSYLAVSGWKHLRIAYTVIVIHVNVDGFR
jgi:hypothetical protein